MLPFSFYVADDLRMVLHFLIGGKKIERIPSSDMWSVHEVHISVFLNRVLAEYSLSEQT